MYRLLLLYAQHSLDTRHQFAGAAAFVLVRDTLYSFHIVPRTKVV